MFWERFTELCKKNSTSPSGVAKSLGLSNSVAVKWKKGSIPDASTLYKIAEKFNVTVDYLLGNEVTVDANSVKGKINALLDTMTEEQLKKAFDIIEAFRK